MTDIFDRIIKIIAKYADEYADKYIIDYYDLFSLDRNNFVFNKKMVRDLLILFHEDNYEQVKEILPKKYFEYYTFLSENMTSIIQILSDDRKRAEYNRKLDNYYQEDATIDMDDDTEDLNFNENIYNDLKIAIMANVNKYGVTKAINTLKKYISSGSIEFCTRNNNARKIFASYDWKYVHNMLMELTGELDDYSISKSIIDKIIDEKVDILFNASIKTYQKHGRGQLYNALISLYKKNIYIGFTNEDNVRKILEYNVDKDDLPVIMKSTIFNENFVFDENVFEELTMQYCNYIHKRMDEYNNSSSFRY